MSGQNEPERFIVTDRRLVPEALRTSVAAAEQAATGQLRQVTGRDELRVEYDRTGIVEIADPVIDLDTVSASVECPAGVDPEEFAEVIDAARAVRIMRDAVDHTRPLPTADQLLAAAQYQRAFLSGDRDGLRHAVQLLDASIGTPPEWTVPAPAPAAAADAALVLYLAACQRCASTGENLGDGEQQHMAVPFGREADRDQWADTHAAATGHRVALVEQHPASGSTITGYIAYDPPVRATAPAPAPPLVSFIARSGQQPELVCLIPERSAAAWLLTAAHAALLGRGSLGIEQPHRVLYVGRIGAQQRSESPDDPTAWYVVRIDGLLGATGAEFGEVIGRQYAVDARLDPASAEDVVETFISREMNMSRALFSVVLMTDAPIADPPDEHAEAVLRQERLDQRAQRGHGDVSAELLAELVEYGPDAPGAVTHRHGQHSWHTHTPDEYADHQQPIDGEVIREDTEPGD